MLGEIGGVLGAPRLALAPRLDDLVHARLDLAVAIAGGERAQVRLARGERGVPAVQPVERAELRGRGGSATPGSALFCQRAATPASV